MRKEITRGRPVRVQSFDGQNADIDAFVVKRCDYKFLLSKPDMKILKLNLYWNAEATVANETCAFMSIADRLVMREDVRRKFPELICLGNLFTGNDILKLKDVTPVRRRPCNTSCEKKLCLKSEIQNKLDAGIITLPSVSMFTSPITLALKEDGSPRPCTDYRSLITKGSIPFPNAKDRQN